MIKTHNLIDIKTKPRHPQSNGIVERFNGTVRDESDNAYGNNYLQAEAIIAKLMQHYNDERLHRPAQALDQATVLAAERAELIRIHPFRDGNGLCVARK